MSVYHVDEMLKDKRYSWISKLEYLTPEHWRPSHAKFNRVDQELMGTIPGDELQYHLCAVPRTTCVLFSQEGRYLAHVGMKTKILFGKLIRPLFRYTNNETVGTAVRRCIATPNQPAPYYIAKIYKEQGTLTIFKPPHGYTLEEWVNQESLNAKQEIIDQLMLINKIN